MARITRQMNGPISQTLCVPTAMKSLKILLPLVILVCIIGPVSAQSTSLDDVLAAMSLRQKVGQMFVATFYGPAINEPARLFLQGYQPGAVVFLPSNLENPNQIARLTNDIQQTLRDSGIVPAFIGVDQEGGIIAHLEQGFTRWPVPMLLTATGDAELAYSVGMAYAQEMQAV
ncbi:MAG: glycoside hydrolase family 3 protein, partial [Anaerolineae bacterium]|nr:glycoside hydrolase family 3 protein [Anaerolineae bacterium]